MNASDVLRKKVDQFCRRRFGAAAGLARKSGCSGATIHYFVNRKADIDLDLAVRIANEIGFSLGEAQKKIAGGSDV